MLSAKELDEHKHTVDYKKHSQITIPTWSLHLVALFGKRLHHDDRDAWLTCLVSTGAGALGFFEDNRQTPPRPG